jgi:hypothetical protein
MKGQLVIAFSMLASGIAAPVHAQVVGCQTMMVSAATVHVRRALPTHGFSAMQVDSAFVGIVLTEEQTLNAIAIVDSTLVADGVLRRQALGGPADLNDQRRELTNARNAKLASLLEGSSEKARLMSNLTAMGRSSGRCDDP